MSCYMPMRTKPNIPDDRSPEDGALLGGWRMVTSGGKVKFNHGVWHSDGLEKYIGLYVYIEQRDVWGLDIVARPNGEFRGPCFECTELGI